MPVKVFINYRRDDVASFAGRVYDRLEREFGRDNLFKDVDAIPLGSNFVKVIDEKVAKCDVLLAIIGPGWLDARDADGGRRLDDPHDFVRIEIAAALKRKIPVVPIFVDGTPVPKGHQLPKEIKELALRHGLDVASFDNDMSASCCQRRLLQLLRTVCVPLFASSYRGCVRVRWLRLKHRRAKMSCAPKAASRSMPASCMMHLMAGSSRARVRLSGSRITHTARKWSWCRQAGS
jgi:TIR domain